MNGRERKIAAIPLAFATLRLATSLANELSHWTMAFTHPGLSSQNAGLPWLPLFFAASLFYSTWRFSHTSHLIFWESLIYLLSGFLGVEGFLTVSTFLHYLLFPSLAVTLLVDLANQQAQHPRPLTPAA